MTDAPGILISELERGLVLRIRIGSWCSRRIRIRVRVGVELIRLLGCGIRIRVGERAGVVEERGVLSLSLSLRAEMGVDVGGEP